MRKIFGCIMLLFSYTILCAQNMGVNETNPTEAKLVVKGSQNGLENALLLKNGFNDSLFRIANNFEGFMGTFRTPGIFNIHGSGEVLRLKGFNPGMNFYNSLDQNIAFHRLMTGSFQIGTTFNSNMPIQFAPLGQTAMHIATDGKVGIGTETPAQNLDINGAIKIGNTNNNVAGSLRYNNNNLELGNGTTWSALGGGGGLGSLPTGVIIKSVIPNDSNILQHGFSLGGTETYNVTNYVQVPTTFSLKNWNFETSDNNINKSNFYKKSTVGTDGTSFILIGPDSDANYLYNPLTDVWTKINGINTDFYYPKIYWTGTEYIIWGDIGGSGVNALGQSGYKFNPATMVATLISTTNAPTYRLNASATWVGDRLIVFGGIVSGNITNQGFAYAPQTNTWSNISNTNAPFRAEHIAAANDANLVIWGGDSTISGDPEKSYANSGFIYNKGTNTWTRMNTTNQPNYIDTGSSEINRNNFCPLIVDNQFILTGISRINRNSSDSFHIKISKYNLNTNTWQTNFPTQRITMGDIGQSSNVFTFIPNKKMHFSHDSSSIYMATGCALFNYSYITNTWIRDNNYLPGSTQPHIYEMAETFGGNQYCLISFDPVISSPNPNGCGFPLGFHINYAYAKSYRFFLKTVSITNKSQLVTTQQSIHSYIKN